MTDSDMGITWNQDGSWLQTQKELEKEWGDTDVANQAVKLSFAVQIIIRRSPIFGWKWNFLQTAKLVIHASIPGLVYPDPDPAFFHKHNPVYCGLESLALVVSSENTGTDLGNSSRSLAAIAHLYNALQQMGRIQGRWDTLDKVIGVHMSAIFAGSLPTTEEQFLKRLMLCMKVPPSCFAKGRIRDGPDWNQVFRSSRKVLNVQKLSTHPQAYLEDGDGGTDLYYSRADILNTLYLFYVYRQAQSYNE